MADGQGATGWQTGRLADCGHHHHNRTVLAQRAGDQIRIMILAAGAASLVRTGLHMLCCCLGRERCTYMCLS
jgi:hypothetical protein